MKEFRLFLSYYGKEIRMLIYVSGILALFSAVVYYLPRIRENRFSKYPTVSGIVESCEIKEQGFSGTHSIGTKYSALAKLRYRYCEAEHVAEISIAEVPKEKLSSLESGSRISIKVPPSDPETPFFWSFQPQDSRPDIE